MKRRDVEKELKKLGFKELTTKGPHAKWRKGNVTIPVPRGNEINEYTARSILKQAKMAQDV